MLKYKLIKKEIGGLIYIEKSIKELNKDSNKFKAIQQKIDKSESFIEKLIEEEIDLLKKIPTKRLLKLRKSLRPICHMDCYGYEDLHKFEIKLYESLKTELSKREHVFRKEVVN